MGVWGILQYLDREEGGSGSGEESTSTNSRAHIRRSHYR